MRAIGWMLCGSLLGCMGPPAATEPARARAAAPRFLEFEPALFARAVEEERLVLLHVGAVWCHWCHVMEETTYRDAEVVALIDEHYLPAYVDQDARPDFAIRYRSWGWPATVIFAPDGTERGRFRGYVPPARFARILEAAATDPSPSFAGEDANQATAREARSALPEAMRRALQARWDGAYDREVGGWGRPGGNRFIDWDSIEWALLLGERGYDEQAQRARVTLDAGRQLFDPVWGGVYQYSDRGVWTRPHFEKVLQYQAEILRAYLLASFVAGRPDDRAAADEIDRYLREFLTAPSGAFLASQDADRVAGEHAAEYFAGDDAERRRQGVPRVDPNEYARETGWGVMALTWLYAAGEDPEVLRRAVKAARWALEHRALPGGGFRHAADDAGGPYLHDTVTMGRCFLRLHEVTGEREWLERSQAAAAFVGEQFVRPGEVGLYTAKVGEDGSGPFAPVRTADENVEAGRWLVRLWQSTRDPAHRALAESAMGFLSGEEVQRGLGPFVAGLLLFDHELRTEEPIHITVVGPRENPAARKLLLAANRVPGTSRRIDWQVPGEPDLPAIETRYPDSAEAVAYVCAGGVCLAPTRDAAGLRQAVAELASSAKLTP